MSRNDRHRKGPRLAGVAPRDLLKEDFANIDARTVLRCSYDVEQLLLIQSVEGHAHAGHGMFHGKTYPNTTQDDISRALRLDPDVVKAERQELIDEITDYVTRAIGGNDAHTACNAEGAPLLRCGTLRHLEVDPRGVLQGIYLGGLRDEAAIRDQANKRYDVTIGFGKSYLVDQSVLERLGLNGYRLAKEGHAQEIERFEEAGLFAENDDENVAYMYVRHVVGPGASDDAAIVIAGKRWGLSAAVGCFLADAVDTLEKYVPEYSDQDADLADYIERDYEHLELSRDDAVDLAYLCAIPEDMQGELPDSSLRHMLQIDRKHDQCALESHLAHVAARFYSPMILDQGECTNVQFYEYVDKRLAGFGNGKR